MKRTTLILVCFLLFSSLKANNSHEFYLSVTEIEYKKDSGALQIISRVFIDDFQKVLNTRYGKNISLSYEKETGDVKNSIKKYLAQKLQLVINGEKLQLRYLGKEYDGDQLILYIEIENVPVFDKMEVTNAILTDLYDDQKNVVHVRMDDQLKSLLLDKEQDKGIINFG
ncbi:hypothetical protein RM549_06585 [Salegentibacter sp. F188]|uniref:Peptidase E n=1 Tax=Autumnicola patrickiae TaxID=3075591 RepID=A0ABU3E182_9FLAO|nr:DUF6702 family protein [Salegentibacter sp. F188]MDT0689444.1 hypothetical protein [Salegentibacter sp. F188]